MGVLPLNLMDVESADSLGLDGTETYDIVGLGDGQVLPGLKTGNCTDTGKLFQFIAYYPGNRQTIFQQQHRI